MFFFNPDSINNLLISTLLLVIIAYFLRRSKISREQIYIIIFLVQILIWNLCFLIRNIYFDPAAAYPLHVFLNSGYTVFSYLAILMFSYCVVTPVFKRESQIVFYSGLLISAGFFIYAVTVLFPSGIDTFYNPALHVYEAEPTVLRKYILFVLLLYVILTAKNLIYKIAILQGEHRAFVINLTVPLIIGISAVVGVSLFEQYYPLDPHIKNTIDTYLVGFLLIYLHMAFLGYARIPFLYSDKTVLFILFIIIIVSSMTTSMTFMIYEDEYLDAKKAMTRQIARFMGGVDRGTQDFTQGLKLLYEDNLAYIASTGRQEGGAQVYLGSCEHALAPRASTVPDGEVHRHFYESGGEKYYCFKTPMDDAVLHVGTFYTDYRKHVHSFVRAGFFTVLLTAVFLFVLMGFVTVVGLTRPLKRLLDGVRDIRSGNLDHRIDIQSQDEIGYVARQFNLMVTDLQVSGEAIKKSEHKFRELAGMLPDIIYETDLDLDITYFNQAGFDITGYTPDEINQGQSLAAILDEDEFIRLRQMLSGKSGKSGKSDHHIGTHRIITRNQEVRYGENNAAVIYENGIPVGLRGVIREVTGKIAMENQLIQAQKMETIGTLAGGIAHDFNNILTGITGTVSLLELKARGPAVTTAAELISDFDILRRSADRAAGMVKQLLALSREKEPVLEQVNLNTIAEGVYDICRTSFDKSIDLNFSYRDGGAWAIADETQLGQVLLNLCVNARDAMTLMRPEGAERSGKLSVFVERIVPDASMLSRFPDAVARPYCCFRVCDTGVGMPPEIIPRIFDPFFTTKKKGEGTGLGLSMVYNIVKRQEGFINIVSEKDSGTTFEVYVPADDSPAKDRDPETIEPGPPKFSATFLLVDDDFMVQKICEEMLAMLGCKVIQAMDGREGVDIYRQRCAEIDVVLLDVVMPVMSGNEAFDELRAIHPDVKVLVSCGFREDPRIEAMLKKGALGFIQKPYTVRALATEISKILK